MDSLSGLFALALAPGIYLAIVIYGKDKYEREPKRILLAAFLMGAFSIIPAALIELFGIRFFHIQEASLSSAALEAFVVVAFTEESCKFLILRFHAFKEKEFKKPFDGIVYGAFVALGFATAENLMYVLRGGFSTGVLRMFSAVPAHYAFGVTMGYFVGKAKFEPEVKTSHMLKGLLFATLLHGAYDFFLIQKNYQMLGIFSVGVLIYSLMISRKEIRELEEDSIFRFKNASEA